MHTLGLVVVATGLVGVIWGIFQRLKAGRLSGAPLVRTGDAAARGGQVASSDGAISVQGNVICQRPLLSPVTGTACLYYSLKTVASWKEGENEKSKVLDDRKVAARFAIDDGSGPVWIDASNGGDFEPEQRTSESKGAGLLGSITGADLAFGNYKLSTGSLSLGTKYEVTETLLPVVPRLYACGRTVERGIAEPGWRSLLLSAKSRDELLAAAARGAKLFVAGGVAALGAGAVMALLGQ
ncbi:E3 ubiquitin ligase family protein [Pendulispora rubella]|uniref:RING-type E3 ubiquitin transferase n=1 Tax=Pendulispora rubella TaxID=2741070 RepID=A0ABZ2L409_9BACT